MYCPKCGHQQVSDDMRFCSRCGFQLTGVAELLVKNELGPPASGQLEKRFPRISRIGAILLFFGIVSVPIFMILSAIMDSPVPLFGSFFFFLAGLASIAYRWNIRRRHDPRKPKMDRTAVRQDGAISAPGTRSSRIGSLSARHRGFRAAAQHHRNDHPTA